MITPGQRMPIVIALRQVDFRRGHDGLAATVQAELVGKHDCNVVWKPPPPRTRQAASPMGHPARLRHRHRHLRRRAHQEQ
jgi:hypothetical protein